MLDFTSLVSKYAAPLLVEEETGGSYNYDNGGKWKPEIQTRETKAAVFNLTAKDISTTMQYGEGGSYTKADVKIYIHEPLTIGSKVMHKEKRYTIMTEMDYADHAHGLRIYLAKGAVPIKDADAKE